MCKCVDIRGHHLGRIASTERTVASEVEGEFPLPLCCYQRDDDFLYMGFEGASPSGDDAAGAQEPGTAAHQPPGGGGQG